MIILIVGNEKVRAEARKKALSGLPSREMLYGVDVEPRALELRAGEQSLFDEARVYGIMDAAESDEWLEGMKEVIGVLSKSKHLFVFEEDAGAAFVKLVERAKGKVIKVKAEKKEESINTFALAGALASRDKKKLWLLYHEALGQGASPEMLAGMLAWKARSMLSSEKNGRVPAGFKAGESQKISSDLVRIYHDAHRGEGPLELLLERFILSL